MQIKKKHIEYKILEGALSAFSEKGYSKTTMKDIATYSNVPIGNIYRYFENKNALFDHLVFDTYSTLLFIHLEEAISSDLDPFLDKLRNLVHLAPLEFSLIFKNSEGSTYEFFREKLINIKEKKYQQLSKTKKNFSPLVLTLISAEVDAMIDLTLKNLEDGEKLFSTLKEVLSFFRDVILLKIS